MMCMCVCVPAEADMQMLTPCKDANTASAVIVPVIDK